MRTVTSLPPEDVIQQWLKSTPTVAPEAIMQALLQLEKQSKKNKKTAIADEFIGNWRLQFVGSKKSPNTPIQALKGSGKALPSWLNIQLTYQRTDDSGGLEKSRVNQGQLTNRVQIGLLALELSGPWLYDERVGIMTFDFLYLKFSVFKRSILSIPVRGGKKAEAQFWKQPLKEKAFFRYFWATPDAIAARGKGGGIALWTNVQSKA